MVGEDENAYAGRWVARVRGRIIAQGGTPAQARHAAQNSRFKETPEIIFMPATEGLTFSPLLESVRVELPDGLDVYLTGGAVRDAFLGRASHDLDFALEKDGILTARRIAKRLKADFYPLDPERDTGRVIVTTEDGMRTLMDFATFRGADLDADLNSRDFTVNAIAMHLRTKALFDPLGGVMDLKEKRLRACSPDAFTDDPVRVLRGIRLAAAYGFHILPETRKSMKAAVGALDKVSPERLRDELFRILEGPRPSTCLRALDLLGALQAILPELSALKGIEQPAPHVNDVWTHTLATLQHLETILTVLGPEYDPDTAADLYNGLLVLRLGRYRQKFTEYFNTPLNINRSVSGLLNMAALYHDVGKPSSKKMDEHGQVRFWDHPQQGAEAAVERARLLALSNDEVVRLDAIIRNHMRILVHTNRLAVERKPPTRRAIYRFFREAGPAGVDILLLALADMRATYEHTLPQESWAACLEVCRLLLENWWEKPEESIAPPQLLNGNELMRSLHLQPGPRVGELLEAIREAQAMGKVRTRREALALARERLKNAANGS